MTVVVEAHLTILSRREHILHLFSARVKSSRLKRQAVCFLKILSILFFGQVSTEDVSPRGKMDSESATRH